MESIPADLVKNLLAVGNTYSQISSYLKQQYPHIFRGLSEMSIRRYGKENNINKEVESDALEAVKECIGEVRFFGHSAVIVVYCVCVCMCKCVRVCMRV